MSAFSENSFDSSTYHSFRPTYPESLYEYLDDYHKRKISSKDLVIDVACGPGEATCVLSKYFKHTIGIDLSATMLATAKQAYPSISFVQSPGETFLDAVEPLGVTAGSVDMVTVAEGIHWFDLDKFYTEAWRSLKPDATLAFWGYCDAAVVGNQKATDTLMECSYGSSALGPFWETPGRNLLRARIPEDPPKDKFYDIQRYENVVVGKPPASGNSSVFVLKRKLNVASLRSYLKSWSSYHTYLKQKKAGEKDLVDECFEKLMEENGWTEETQVELEWDSFLVLARKKA